LTEKSNLDLKQVAMARFVASALISVTECWLERGARESPKQVQTLFAEFVGSSVRC
ncbi:MAG: TetR family transcriptional regulator C-terminal domain-containing protein, partial [Acidobacteria bacterium]|nr:TetR family transcriptional regulator C-terminal domain-containing protein [Acidobacteriota bacterium]